MPYMLTHYVMRQNYSHHTFHERVIHEFSVRGIVPPHCTPENLARALEGERQMTIVFRSYESNDFGVNVYGSLYRQKGSDSHYVIFYRTSYSIILQYRTLFHELAHLLFRHKMSEIKRGQTPAGKMHLGYEVSNEDEAEAEAFACMATQYALLDPDGVAAYAGGERSPSEFGQLLDKTRYFA